MPVSNPPDRLLSSTMLVNAGTNTSPSTDNVMALGTTALRYTNLFLSGSILDSASAQIYLRRSGADTLTGNWNTGDVRVGINTATVTGRLNIPSVGNATATSAISAIRFTKTGTINEFLLSSADPAANNYGWHLGEDNNADGDFRLWSHAATTITQRLRLARDSNHLLIGSTLVAKLGGEALQVPGLIQTSGGITMNVGGGNTDPNDYFKYYDSGGVNWAMAINPTVGTGGVGFFVSSYSTLMGILTVGAGRVSTPKAGLGIVLPSSVADAMPLYISGDTAYSATSYGQGILMDNLNNGDALWFVKRGDVGFQTPVNSVYHARSNGQVGIGPDFGFSGVTTGTAAPSARLHISAGTATAGTAPLKFTSGTSLTTAVAGCMEYTTDDLFFTISTGAARKRITFADPVGGLTSGRVPFATTNGRLTDDADFTFATDTLTVTKIAATQFTGDIQFTGSGVGLPYGGMYLDNPASFAVTLTSQNTYYELNGTTAWTASPLNNVTATDPYLTVTIAGTYLITWTLSGSIDAVNEELEFGIMLDQTTVQAMGTAHKKFLGADTILDVSGVAILTLTANQKVSLAAQDITSAGKVLTINHGQLTVVQIGG